MDRIPDWYDESHKTIGAEEPGKSVRQQRIEICEQCPDLTKFKFCNACGCFMPVKTYLKAAKCPRDKW